MDRGLLMLAAAFLIDRFLGEYPSALHPVVWIGKIISACLWAAPHEGWWRQLLFGAGLALGITSLGIGTTLLALHLTASVPWLHFVVGTFLLKASFALRALGEAARRVREAVQKGELASAREALRSLCSRDPSNLNAEGLLAATVQSVAENTSDSFVAPLFYYLCFGVAGAVGYRAINSLDAMIGYRGRFEALGKFSARLDDLANWVPARLTALLLVLSGWLCDKDVAHGWRILCRDGGKTPSPNGGRPMAVMAGLLGVALEKKGVYTLGDARTPLTPETAATAWRLTERAGWLMVLLI